MISKTNLKREAHIKVLVTRVNKAGVSANGKLVSSIAKGIAVFVGLQKGDSAANLAPMAQKIVNLRIFEDDQGRMNYCVKDGDYQILCVSNFTLCANTDKGRRPSFENSMPKQEADKLFSDFLLVLGASGLAVQSGAFGDHMDIDLDLDGPVNIILSNVPSII